MSTQEVVSESAIDFNQFLPGTRLSDQVPGLAIWALNNKDGAPDLATTFDSSSPSGGDSDLGTPNQRYGGPGRCTEGTSTKWSCSSAEQTNQAWLGIVVIIAEDDVDTKPADGYIDDPDDSAPGGELHFRFEEPFSSVRLGILDIEESGGHVCGLDSNGATVDCNDLEPLGDNSFQEIRLRAPSMREVVVTFTGSGAVPYIDIEPEVEPHCPGNPFPECDPPENVEICTDMIDNDGDGAVDCLDPDCHSDTGRVCGDDCSLVPSCQLILDDPAAIKFQDDKADQLKIHARMEIENLNLDIPTASQVSFMLANRNGVIFKDRLAGCAPIGDFNCKRKTYRYKYNGTDPAPGIVSLKLKKKLKHAVENFVFTIQVQSDLAAATDPAMLTQMVIDDQPFYLYADWTRTSKGDWKLTAKDFGKPIPGL